MNYSNEKPTMKVINFGLPRTASMSFSHAMEIIGYGPCVHFKTALLADRFPYPAGRKWRKVYQTTDKVERQALLRELFESGGWQSTADFPACSFVEDLMEMYPDAKFILSVRKSPSAWRTSFNSTIGLVRSPWYRFTVFPLPLQSLSLQPILAEWDEYNKRQYNGAQAFHTDTEDLYLRHNDYVRRTVPQDKLLVHEASQGWEPLCKFIGIPVPDEPYPRVNDTEELLKNLMFIKKIGMVYWTVALAATYGTYRFFL